MIIATSLSPTHSCRDNQITAINSWKKYGKCYSFNHPKELPLLSQYSGIQFVPTEDVSSFSNKPLIKISSFINYALTHNEDLLIINSDIILKDLPKFKDNGITMLSRYDYNDNLDDNSLFLDGFDVFYIPKSILPIFPSSIFALGAAWHDFFTPMIAIKSNIPLYYPNGKYAFHKKHRIQYNYEEWLFLGDKFKNYFKLHPKLSIPQVAQNTMSLIQNNLICEI